MTEEEIKKFEELRERLGDSMHNCETDQLIYYTEQIYQDSESLVNEIRALRAYLRFVNELDYYDQFRQRCKK